MSNRRIVVEAAFGLGPFSDLTSATWTDLGEVNSAEWSIGRSSEFEDYPAGEAVVVVKDPTRRLDPDNTSAPAPFNGNLKPRVPVRIRSQDVTTLAYANEFYGYVSGGWELQPSATTNFCKLELVDLLGALSLELPDVFEHEVLSWNPKGFWVLDKAQGETVADLGSGRREGMVVGEGVKLGDRPIVPGHSPAAFFDVAYTANEEEIFGHIDLGRSPILSNPTTAMVMLNFSVRGWGGRKRVLFVQQDGNAFATGVVMELQTSGHLTYRQSVNGTTFQPTTIGEEIPAHGASHIAFGWSDSLQLDGGAIFIDPSSSLVSNGWTNGVGIAGATGVDTESHFHGWLGVVAIWDNHATVGASGRTAILDAYDKLNGDRTDQQIAWALDTVGVPANMRNLGTGTVYMGPADTKGHDALDWIREVTATEQGEFYVDHRGGGKLRFRDRYARHLASRSNTSQVTFDDRNGIPATIPYSQDGLQLAANGLDSIVNTVKVSWRDGDLTVTDDTSVNAYGPRPRSIDTQATAAAQARSVGEWLVARRKNPMSQVRGCTSSARAMRDRNDKLQALEIGDRVTFRIQPGNTGNVTTRDLWVEGLTHRCQGMTWETSVRFSPADTFSPWVWGTGAWNTTAVWG